MGDNLDLRNQIYHLKKQMLKVNAENQLLKVKIRKLQDDIMKKDKQLDSLFDPAKSQTIRKLLYEKSASFLINMKEKNDKLLQTINDKDIIIRRLQNQLDVAKLYSQGPRKRFNCKCDEVKMKLENNIKQISINVPDIRKNIEIQSETEILSQIEIESKNIKKKKGRCQSCILDRSSSTIFTENKESMLNEKSYDIKEQYKGLSRDHLLSIIESLKSNQISSRNSSSRKSSPESDLDRIELLCDSPHEEIQQLHLHFLNMITEVDALKNTIFQLKTNQEKTDDVLKKKNNSIGRLETEIKNLKKNNCVGRYSPHIRKSL